MRPDDWKDVARIYSEGIMTGNATFEMKCPDWDSWDRDHKPECRLVAREGKSVLGWAALSAVSGRCVYAGVCEVSIYIDLQHQGKGIGQLLMEHLIRESERNGIWTLRAGIFPENVVSIRLHEKNGFILMGLHEKLAKMDGVWRDVLLFERRSKKAGLT